MRSGAGYSRIFEDARGLPAFNGRQGARGLIRRRAESLGLDDTAGRASRSVAFGGLRLSGCFRPTAGEAGRLFRLRLTRASVSSHEVQCLDRKTMRKERTPIPQDVAADILFSHRNTCCVCNEPGRQFQIHHIDDDPSNHAVENLAGLCLEDHHRTQVTGGFARKLTAQAVARYRDDWVKRVESMRKEADKIAIGRMSGEPVASAGTSTSAEVNNAHDIEWKRPPRRNVGSLRPSFA